MWTISASFSITVVALVVHIDGARIPYRPLSQVPQRVVETHNNYNYQGIFIVPCYFMLGVRTCKMLPFKDGYLDVLDCSYYLGPRVCNHMHGSRVLIPGSECGARIGDRKCSYLPHHAGYVNLENCEAILRQGDCKRLTGAPPTMDVALHPYQLAPSIDTSVRISVQACAAIIGEAICNMFPEQNGEINMDVCPPTLTEEACNQIISAVSTNPTDIVNSPSNTVTPPLSISSTNCIAILGEAACNQLPQQNGLIDLNNCAAILGNVSCQQLSNAANGNGSVPVNPTPTAANPSTIDVDLCIAILGVADCNMITDPSGLISLDLCLSVLGEAECQQLSNAATGTITPTPSLPSTSGAPSTTTPGASDSSSPTSTSSSVVPTQTSTSTPCPINPTPSGTTSTCSCTPIAPKSYT